MSSQEQPGAASSSQEEQGAAVSSQEEQPGAARSNQEHPGAARSRQDPEPSIWTWIMLAAPPEAWYLRFRVL